jgi:hypothetical protein
VVNVALLYKLDLELNGMLIVMTHEVSEGKKEGRKERKKERKTSKNQVHKQ